MCFATIRVVLGTVIGLLVAAGPATAETPENLRDGNLVAWCIVPFDAKSRGPAERAEMVRSLGLRRVAYDWREQHVATFEEEIEQYRKHGIEFFAFWGTHDRAFELFRKHDLHPQIWQTAPSPAGASQEERVAAAVRELTPLVERTRKEGLKLGLYNHGGWGGEPANLVAVCKALRVSKNADHVGIVYNLHHAHDHLKDFAASLDLMKPYLLCLNLNGMTEEGERRGKKILPLGAGELDAGLLRTIRGSGYDGPIGIIGHTQDDVEERLRDNLDGLHWLLPQLEGAEAGPKPAYRTWKPDPNAASPPANASTAKYSAERVADLLRRAKEQGDPVRGLTTFGSATSACLSCHKVGRFGGIVGPDLAASAPKRTAEELVEAILWPKRKVEAEYVAHAILDSEGRSYQGYVLREDDQRLVFRDTTAGAAKEVELAKDEIELRREVGTLMPENLAATMSEPQLLDLIAFVITVGREGGPTVEQSETLVAHSQAHFHKPATFPYDKQPLSPTNWPYADRPVNGDRLYDFYTRQAEWFRTRTNGSPSSTSSQSATDAEHAYVPGQLLADFPGLDGGPFGHWGTQNEGTWASDGWSRAVLDSVQCGVFRKDGLTLPRAVCVRVGGAEGVNVCFNPETLAYEAIWKGPFLKFSTVRHGFMHGLEPGSGSVPAEPSRLEPDPAVAGKPFEYRGYWRMGDQIVFAYRADGEEYLDAPTFAGGKFVRVVAKADEHPLAKSLSQFEERWPQRIETPIELSERGPYTIDTIGLPFESPWKMPIFPGGHAFLPDGSALVCTMQGDVWHVSGFEYPSKAATWRRFASGLHQALGIVADDDGVFVLGRDQITKLHDMDGDGEADFYERFSASYEASPAGHDFICGLERDAEGNFYTASGNQGLLRVAADGKRAEVLATGFRNPDGLGLYPDGVVTVPVSEGEWTPASMICAVRTQGGGEVKADSAAIPHFGYRGPVEGKAPELPMVYLPRGLDNSSGGQTYIDSERWGPLRGNALHFSFGACTYFLVLRDEVRGQLQGAVVPLPGEFRSGVHRGRFSPKDGQLYVSGMQGWGTYAIEDGCFERVRYTGAPAQLPVGIHVHQNGVLVRFAEPLDPAVASDAASHFAQSWNYRYGPAYGSPEFSSRHRGMRGHDVVKITSAQVLDDGTTLFLELPELQPVNQLHLRLQSNEGTFHDLFATVNALDEPFTALPGYRPLAKRIEPHSIHADLALATRSVPNPHRNKIAGARGVTIETAGNLSFATRTLRVRAGEAIALTLSNPDVVPHNWALIRPGSLEAVGTLADRLISDPDAALRHYVPETDDVLAYVDVVSPREKSTIWFKAPKQPGRYPYLCTFPGHWKAMNGELIVEPAASPVGARVSSAGLQVAEFVSADRPGEQPAWVPAMREVHAKFDGDEGSLSLFGDSITVSLAFWAPLADEPKGLSDELRQDLVIAKNRLRPETWRGQRGPAFGNEGGRTVRWAHDNTKGWLKKLNPEVAVVMFGTNDLASLEAEEYRTKLREVVEACLANGTIVLLTTIPPRHGFEEKSAQFAQIARDVANELRVPLVDYVAAVHERRPTDWDGAAETFADPDANADVYDVPALIARDGVHPSNPRDHQSHSEEDLSRNGFALRNASTLETYADVVRKVLEPVGSSGE
ncbi:MAG TPA: GDSL-type esterase/lipase family protein [Pirellulaceae bacterium]|jgi:putative heme-binding domain-containing protein|nr:GDSL-type esterase/lipase family protein [Pirellulaceae bacterium]